MSFSESLPPNEKLPEGWTWYYTACGWSARSGFLQVFAEDNGIGIDSDLLDSYIHVPTEVVLAVLLQRYADKVRNLI